ncbi:MULTISPECIES: TonB-dependent receptor [unclassified Methylophilus]|uniref:TonB-dependent receptor n=1 Tax=unclassified Methylophilus TaxID=2630143 RepID=UPI000701D5D6|nr:MULTISPECIES: TonB-dependent receptor [unclassified Methylophilus]KQT41731.1 TonB-dependent receptor [Methylophilus sp. Leaf416]KQT55898.1 TonB-dependent receptor [Methylophilus sp. Leaf459]
MTARTNFQLSRRTKLKQLSIAALLSISLHVHAATANIDIVAQSLDQAILSLGKQSGENIAFPSDLASTLKAPAVKGNYSVQQALELLLKGTGLTTQKTPAGYSVVKQVENNTETLPEVQIKDKAIKDITAEYPGGQVARGGKVGLLGNKDLMDTPFSATQYTSKLIEDQQAQNLGDVLVNDPSIRNTYSRGSGRDEFNIRGFTLFNYDAMFNGLYGISPRDSSSMIGIERVEVLRGPNALLNGIAPGGSVGGAINLVPKRAGYQPLNRMTLSYIDDSQLAAHADVARRFGADQQFGVRLNAIKSSGDTPVDHSKERLDAIAIGLDFQGERFRLEGDINYQNRLTYARSGLLFADTGVRIGSAPDAKSNFFPKWTYWDSNQISGTTRAEFDLTTNWMVYGAFGGSEYDFSSLQTSWLLTNQQGDIASRPARTQQYVKTLTGEMGVRGKFVTGALNHQPVLSVTNYFMESGFQSDRIGATFSNIYSPQDVAKPAISLIGNVPKAVETRLRSIALADTMSILDNAVQLTLGVRHQEVIVDSFDAAGNRRLDQHYDESKLTPTVAVVIRPTEKLSLYANYIEALNQGPIDPNSGQTFAPMVSKQREAGMKYDFGRFATTVSVFEIERASEITDPATLLLEVNGKQRNRGIEFLTQGEVVENVRILGGLALTEGKLVKTEGGTTDGNTAPAVPRQQFNLAAEWDTSMLPGLTLTARMLHTGEQYLDPENTQKIPSWNRYDLGARYAFTTGKVPVTVRGSIENLFDKNYWLSAARQGLSVGAPRTVLLSVTADF